MKRPVFPQAPNVTKARILDLRRICSSRSGGEMRILTDANQS